MIDTFYDIKNDIIYAVPLRCGTSFFRDRILRIGPDFRNPADTTLNVGVNPDVIQCTNLEEPYVSIAGGPFSENVGAWIYTLCTTQEKFKNTRVWILYRDPIVRYKSGLVMALQSYYNANTMDLNVASDEELQPIINSAKRLIIDSTLPAYNLADSHTTPVMHLQLLLYTMLPGRCKFIHLKELNALATELYDVKFDMDIHNKTVPNYDAIHYYRSNHSEIATDFAQRLFDMLSGDDVLFGFPRTETYTFRDWLTPDIATYNGIRNDPEMSQEDAEKLFVSALYSHDLTVVRSRSIIKFYRYCLRTMPEGLVKSALGKQIANLGNNLKEYIFTD